MPKAYDIGRNYYADLDLPTTATIDEIKKQYRKLALAWHPDRNAGNEEECVPRFQAIQAAHEILSDPAQKAKYDADRRVAGPFAGSSFTQPPPAAPRGNPYQAKSNFPPPPRRTAAPPPYSRPSRPPANGADRFSNFAPPPKQQPSTSSERVNQYQAWERMKNTQKTKAPDRDTGTAPGSTAPSAQAPPRRRPHLPPRNDTQFPSEEKIRNSYKYRDDADNAAARQSAWDALNKGQQMPGMKRSNTTRTPKKQGFDPNAPGSDERPAANGNYMHRHRSEDFGQPAGPVETRTPSPKMRRPFIDPTNPNHRDPEDVPFSEANRARTPYSSTIGDKTDFSGTGRSKSYRDTTTLNSPPKESRPQSTTPTGVHRPTRFEGPTNGPDADNSSSEGYESPFTKPPTFPRPEDRPKKVPSPPSKRFTSSQPPFPPPSESDDQSKRRNIFEFANGTTFTPPPIPTGKSRSEENINIKFASDFNGTFTSQASASQSRPTSRQNTRQNSKTRGPPTFGQPSPLGTNLPRVDIPPPPPHPPTSAPGSAAEAFSPEVWKQHFADGSWAVPPPPPRTDATTSEDDKARDSGFATAEPDEMDIDTEPPAQDVKPTNVSTTVPLQADAKAMPPPPRPRNVPVPPSQWHQDQKANSSQLNQTADADLNTNLDDWRHVEPLARDQGAGLDSFADVSADLPFKSQASHAVPVSRPSELIHDIPQVPVPPTVPQVITNTTWTHYAADFARYVGAYHVFNGRFLRHFMARQEAMEEKIGGGMDWLKASGDLVSPSAAKGPAGFPAYVKETEEDAKLKETWIVGCDRHVDAVKAFEGVRERVRRLTQAGSLVG